MPNPPNTKSKNSPDSDNLHTRVLAISSRRSSIWLYKIGRFSIKVLGHRYFRAKVHNAKNLALPGRFIIAAVHRSNLDGPLINSLSTRRIKSLAKIAMFKSRIGIYISATLGCVPVDREANDRKALKQAAELLENEEALLLFPEGLRGSGSQVGKIFGGCAYLALKTGCPIVPVAISGTESAMPPGKKIPQRSYVNIEVGTPISPSHITNTKIARDKITAQLQTDLQALQDIANSKTSSRTKP